MRAFDIGFTGTAGSGKDSAARFIYLSCKEYTIRSFAGPLKEMAVGAGWDGVKNERGRCLLQDLGMALRRYDRNAWIKLADKFASKSALAVLWTDVRFKNEAEYIRRRGGIIIRIERDGHLGEGMTDLTAAHVSEQAMGEIVPDYTIQNNGTWADLHLELSRCIKAEADKRQTK